MRSGSPCPGPPAASADGYTLVLTPTGNLTVNQALYRDLPFDTARDFLPLTVLATGPNVLVVNRTVAARRVAELVADAAYPGFEVTSWYGVAVRSGTPPEIVDRLYRETAEVLTLDEVKERFAGMGVEPGGLPPQEFAALVRSETKKWGDIIVRANIKLELRRSPPCPTLPFPGRSAPPTTSAP